MVEVLSVRECWALGALGGGVGALALGTLGLETITGP